MTYFCNECDKVISEDVYKYSRVHYSRPLCFEHQPKSNLTTKKSHYNKPEPTPQALKLGNLLKSMGHKVEFEKYDGYKHIDIAIVEAKLKVDNTECSISTLARVLSFLTTKKQSLVNLGRGIYKKKVQLENQQSTFYYRIL
jgi:hypothetical protein